MNRKKVISLLLCVIISFTGILGGCTKQSKEQSSEENAILAALAKVEKEKYKPLAFGQQHIESDTVQWFNTAYAIFTYANGKDLDLIGGLEEDYGNMTEAIKIKMQGELKSGWKITNRKTAIKQLRWLVTEGHSKVYGECLDEIKKEKLTEASIQDNSSYDDKKKAQLLVALEVRQIFPKSGIKGWDYSRALQVIGDCYHAGYLNLSECMDISLPIGQELQELYSNWEGLAESYLYGYQFWSGEYPINNGGKTAARKEAYEELKALEDSPYERIPYDLDLVVTWDEDTGNAVVQEELDEAEKAEAEYEKSIAEDEAAIAQYQDKNGNYPILCKDDKSKKATLNMLDDFTLYPMVMEDATHLYFANDNFQRVEYDLLSQYIEPEELRAQQFEMYEQDPFHCKDVVEVDFQEVAGEIYYYEFSYLYNDLPFYSYVAIQKVDDAYLMTHLYGSVENKHSLETIKKLCFEVAQ